METPELELLVEGLALRRPVPTVVHGINPVMAILAHEATKRYQDQEAWAIRSSSPG